jgi:tetratricopeptide (TPR) repeat protein
MLIPTEGLWVALLFCKFERRRDTRRRSLATQAAEKHLEVTVNGMPTSHDEIKKLADAASVDAASLDLEALSLMDADDVKTAIDKAKAIDVSDVDPAKLEATKADATKKLGAGDLVGAADGYLATLAMCKSPALLQQYGPALYSNLALVHHKSGDAAASLAAADESIKLKPEWHKAHFRRGEALFELRRHADALASYQEASRLSPADADVKRMVKLTEAAAKGGLLLLQLSPGRDIAIAPTTPMDQLIFGAAASMKNFIYLIADATSRECFCVDPCWDPKGIATYAEKQKLKLVGAIGTHYHFDHVRRA